MSILSRFSYYAAIAICAVCIAATVKVSKTLAKGPSTDAAASTLTNDEAIRQMEQKGFIVDDDSLLDQNGAEVMQRSMEDGGSENSSAISPDGTSVGNDFDRDLDSDQDATIAAQGCTTWWLHGSHKWKYKNYILYTYAKFKALSQTTYGTQKGSCGTPLVVDKLSFDAKIGSDEWSNFDWSKTGYNTSRVKQTRKAHGFNIGSPCGMRVLHEASKNGIKWYFTTRSGCFK
jgi:hypothetical protein